MHGVKGLYVSRRRSMCDSVAYGMVFHSHQDQAGEAWVKPSDICRLGARTLGGLPANNHRDGEIKAEQR